MNNDVAYPLLNHGASRPTRNLIILGASGSVGGTAVEYLRRYPAIKLSGISVNSSVDTLRALLKEFSPTLAAISDESVFDKEAAALKSEFPGIQFFRGDHGLVEMIEAGAANGTDTVLTAVVGACGIRATFAALKLNLKIALANKETLVTAGPAIVQYMADQEHRPAAERPVILPVDSEHNALFQLIVDLPAGHLQKVILTASGGPFRDQPPEILETVGRAEVLNHPTWAMGPKITVDSAGMINKGLEVIEAHYLFSLPYDQVDVLIHKHSVVHGLIETTDGGFLICASQPHMVYPTAHALLYPEPVPERHEMSTPPEKWPPLEFAQVDPAKYPGYSVCRQAGEAGGTAPAILNAANEVAVELFLEDQIRFVEIPRLIQKVLEKIPNESGTELELFLAADERARALTRELV